MLPHYKLLLRSSQRRNPNLRCARPHQNPRTLPSRSSARQYVVDQQNLAPADIACDMEGTAKIPPPPFARQNERALCALAPLHRRVRCGQLPLRPQLPQPPQTLIRQQNRLVISTLPFALPEQWHSDHHQIVRRLTFQQQNRLCHPPPQQPRNAANPRKLQQVDQPSHLVVVASVRDSPGKFRLRQPALAAKKPLRQHPGKSCIFQIQVEVDRLAALATPKSRVSTDAPHARLTNRNSRSPLERTRTALAISRKNRRNNVVKNRTSPTSKNPYDRAPPVHAAALHPTGWTCRINSELGIQAIAEDSPTRRRSRSVRPRHDRSISLPHHIPSRITAGSRPMF